MRTMSSGKTLWDRHNHSLEGNVGDRAPGRQVPGKGGRAAGGSHARGRLTTQQWKPLPWEQNHELRKMKFPFKERIHCHWIKTIMIRGFPWWLSGKESACQGKRRGIKSLIPDPTRCHMPQSKEAHAPQLRSLCSRARESQLLNPRVAEAPVLQGPCSTTRGATTMSSLAATTREEPLLAQPEEVWAAGKTQHGQKYIN